jgi:hypothetical protein
MEKQSPNSPANVFPADTPLHRASQKKDKTGAARAKAYRLRKKQHFISANASAAEPSSERSVPPNAMSTDGSTEEPSELPPANAPHKRSENALLWSTGMKRATRLTEEHYNRASSLSAANAFGKLIKKVIA